MKKVIITSLLFIVTLILPVYTYANLFGDYLPTEDRIISLSTGGFILFEWGGNKYVLADTRSGRVWKLIGEISKPNHFESIKYENAKGMLVDQPENETTNQFPGRFAFKEWSRRNYVLDTMTGNLWILEGTYENPIKLTLIPRKD